MSEEHSPYHASSGDPHQLPLPKRHAVTIVPEFPPLPLIHVSKPDILILIPILDSPENPDENPVCLQLVHLPDGTLGLCNGKRTLFCPCCGNACCNTHASTCFVTLPNADGTWSRYTDPLCVTCASLTQEQIYRYHAFRTGINEEQGRVAR